jgi:GT2 family glycosyltransferase
MGTEVGGEGDRDDIPPALPSFSVVIPSHNRPDLLALCLRSVQSHAPAGTEIIVVDDASPGACVSHTAVAFPGVRTLRQAKRRGFCAAVNAGVAAARGDVVELLNDDTEVCPGWAEAALSCFADPVVAAVAPLVLFGPAGTHIDSAGDAYFLGGYAAKRGHGERVNARAWEPGPVFGASGSSAFYRRDVLLRIGGFPESFGAYFEDVDVSFRLRRAGQEVYFEPRSRVLHRVSASYGRRPGRRVLEMQSRNEERVFWRNLPTTVLLRALPLHLAVLAGKAWQRWGEGTLLPWACGRLRVLGEAAEIVRHRRGMKDWSGSGDLFLFP